MNIPNAFERLDPDIQRMLWDMKWTSLHGFQVDAINAWFDTERDLLLMAHTAAGKTEAAFLPALSTIAPDRGRGSVRVMYVGPLKALINDQFRRVEDLCVRAEIPVHRWHGDVDAKRKRDVVAEPTGVVLITPESLEALLMLKGNQVNRMFSRLEAVIIDELHVFLESARGRQLNSLLARIDAARGNGKRTRRIGLSATIGDVAEAQQWLGGNADNTLLISSSDTGEKELLITTFIHRPQRAFADETATPETDTGSPAETVEEEDDEEVIDEGALLEIAEHVLKRFSGKTNLIFCNRKTDIEELADHLGRLCKRQNVPNEFTVHHGSLSKENREAVEQDLQSGRPHTALCSSTLELGIDVGYIDAVGHVRPPHSVSALKQRIGRSGRREGTVPRMWLYCPVLQVDTQDRLVRQLYPDLVQAIAEVQLMTEGWVEPPFHVTEDLSTLIQQVLSITRERGGTKASELSELLRNTHAFKGMSPQVFAQVLDELKRRDLLEHAEDGDLILGLRGEKLVSHYDFYAAFVAQDEYDVVNGKDHVGSIPIMVEYAPGHRFLLAGRRWEIMEIDHERRIVQVKRSKRKQTILWPNAVGHTHRRIHETMRDILVSDTVPPYINAASREVLTWSRRVAATHQLAHKQWVLSQGLRHLFTWAGSRGNYALMLYLRSHGIEATLEGSTRCALSIDASVPVTDIREALGSLVATQPDPARLAYEVLGETVPPTGKHDHFLSAPLRARSFAATNLDMEEGALVAQNLLSSLS